MASIMTTQSLEFVKLTKLDGTKIRFNIRMINAFIEKGDGLSIFTGNEWIDVSENIDGLNAEIQKLFTEDQ